MSPAKGRQDHGAIKPRPDVQRRTNAGAKRAFWILSVALAALEKVDAASQEAPSSEADEFQRVFGQRPPVLTRMLSVPLILNQRPHEEILVTLPPEPHALRVHVAPLLNVIEALASPETLAQLRTLAGSEQTLSLDQIRKSGIEAIWDEQRLELHLTVSPEARRGTDLQLYGRFVPEAASGALPQSTFSVYLNLRTGLDYVHRDSSGRAPGFQPFHGELEGAVNVHKWVIEGSGSYTQDSRHPWRRGNLRLVRDSPKWRIRASLGDLAYPTTGFQSFQPLVGLTIARNFALQPYRVTEPRGQTSFFLKSPAKVDVLLNGQVARTLQLPAGPHNLQDFLFTNGSNDVALQIMDDVGRVEIVRYSFFYDTRLLAVSEQEFSYSLGLPPRMGAMLPRSDSNEPVVSLFHRVGVTDTFTAGLNAQGNERQQLLGVESVWATPYGTFQPEMAVSEVDGIGGGFAARLGYRYYDATRTQPGSWAVAAQYRSLSFASLGDLKPHNAVAWDISARHSRQLPWGLSGGLGGSYQVPRSGGNGFFAGTMHFSKRFGSHSSADINLEHRRMHAGATENRVFISVNILLPGRRQSLRATHDTLTGSSRVDWQYAARDRIGGFDGNLGVQQRSDDYGVVGGLRYSGNRAEASLSHDLTSSSKADVKTDSRTRYRFGTALVFADGHLALSRPISDSFVLLKVHPDFAGHDIGVDPMRDSYAAKIDRWGPAVVPNLGSYLVRNVLVEAPELPPGYELGPGAYLVWPTYRSGTVIRVGTGATVLLSGVLEMSDGTPVALQLGEIVSLSDPQRAPLEIFTNRRGKFSVAGLRPGGYEIRMFNGGSSARFEIPLGKAGLYDLGFLQMSQVLSSRAAQVSN